MINLKKFFILLTAIVLLVTTSLVILLNTQLGFNGVLTLTKRFIALEFSQATGNFSHFSLKNVTLKNQNITISCDSLTLNWKLYPLLQHTLFIERGDIENLQLDIASTATNSSQNNTWIKKVWINNLNIAKTSIRVNNTLKTQIKKFSILQVEKFKHALNIELGNTSITGFYRQDKSQTLPWEIYLHSQDADLSTLWPGLPQKIFLDLHLLANWQRDHEQILFKNVLLKFKNSIIEIQGTGFANWHLKGKINIPNLSELYQPAHGSLFILGTITTLDSSPLATLDIHGNDIQVNDVGLKFVEGKISSDLKQDLTTDILLNLSKLKINDFMIPKIIISGTNLHKKGQEALSLQLLLTPENIAKLNLQTVINEKKLSGTLTAKFSKISEIIHLPFAKNLEGLITATLHVNGSWDDLDYKGSINFKNFSANLPKLNLHPKNIDVNATFSKEKLTLDGSFKSGNGLGNINGFIDLTHPFYPAILNLSGNNLNIIHTNEYQITASPHLTLSHSDQNLKVTGTLILPRIRIILQDYYNVLTLPPEVEFVGKDEPFDVFKNLSLRFKLELGNDVLVKYKALTAKIMGAITVFQVPGGMPSGNGILQIPHGTYQIYDKAFVFNNGALTYIGNLLTNPGLNIRAIQSKTIEKKNILGFSMSSQNQNIEVGVQIRGTLDEPIISLISNPPMTQDDILSYMVFGQSRENISSVNALALLGSLSSDMNLPGPSLGDQPGLLGGLLGVFKMGIFNAGQAFNLTFPLSKYLAIQTETSLSETGGDIMYQYER